MEYAIVVIGAGPAGLSCAHRLALLGHAVALFDDKAKLGGLNEYGLATYKTVDDFAQKEIRWLLSIGGIEVKGPNVFAGYWRMPDKTREEFTADGWFRTGDLARIGLTVSAGGADSLMRSPSAARETRRTSGRARRRARAAPAGARRRPALARRG